MNQFNRLKRYLKKKYNCVISCFGCSQCRCEITEPLLDLDNPTIQNKNIIEI